MAVTRQIPLQSPFAYLRFFRSSCERHFSHQAVVSLKVHKNGCDALTILTIAFVYLRSFVPSCERHFSHEAAEPLKVHKESFYGAYFILISPCFLLAAHARKITIPVKQQITGILKLQLHVGTV
jgi:hypothetical protein